MRRYVRILLNIAIPLLWLFLLCVLGPRLLGFFMPFVIGWILAMIANPPVRFLERRLRLVRKHGSMVIVVGVLAAILGLIYVLFLGLYRELSSFMEDAPALYESARLEIAGALENGRRLAQLLPDSLEEPVLAFSDNLGNVVSSLLSQAAMPTVEIAGNVARGIPGVLVNTVVIILSSYLFLADRERILTWMRSHLPAPVFCYISYLKRDARGLIGGYFLAQFRIMFVVAAILAAGFVVLGVRYSLLLAVLVAILDFLPVFGTGTVLLPWAVVKLFTAEYAYAAGLLLLYVLTQVVRQLIQPKIVGDSMGLNPLLTLFLLYLGFKVRGLAGMILAVPAGLIVINFYKYGAFDSLIRNVRFLWEEIERLRRED